VTAGGPRAPTGDLTLFGIHYAVVTQNKDDLKLARVKVRFPWLDHGDTDQTHWALVSVPMVGDKYGFYTLPEIDDVVAVMFIAGDITRPVVLGGVWSATDKPPEETNEFRGFRSRAGNRMVMDDTSNGKVYFNEKSDKIGVVVGSFQKGGGGLQAKEAPAPKVVNGSAATEGVNFYIMEGDLEITAKGKITVTAGTHIDVVSDQNFDCKASSDATYEADGLATYSGGGSAKIEGSNTNIN
jgi:uncharacterized protein involved in type VI secretion and phage assembly